MYNVCTHTHTHTHSLTVYSLEMLCMYMCVRPPLYSVYSHNTGSTHWLDPRLTGYMKQDLLQCSENGELGLGMGDIGIFPCQLLPN